MAKRPDALAQSHGERAIQVMAEIMNDGLEKASDRLNAAKEILDRGYGKPAQATISLPATREQLRMLAGFTDEQLLTVVESAPLPKLEYHDAEFEPVKTTGKPSRDTARDPLLD